VPGNVDELGLSHALKPLGSPSGIPLPVSWKTWKDIEKHNICQNVLKGTKGGVSEICETNSRYFSILGDGAGMNETN